MSSPDELKSTPRYDRIVATSRQIAWDLGHTYVGGRASFPRHHAGPQTRCPPKSSGGLSLRGRLVLPSVTSSPRRGGAAVEATHRRPAAVPSEPCQRGRCSPGQVCPSRDVPTIAASSGRSHAGFVPHRESADLGGHKRSRWVRRSRRSQHLPAPDLGRPSTWTRLRVPPHLLFRSTGVIGLGSDHETTPVGTAGVALRWATDRPARRRLLPICCLGRAIRGRTRPDWASDLRWS
jgi:hypothetical protein